MAEETQHNNDPDFEESMKETVEHQAAETIEHVAAETVEHQSAEALATGDSDAPEVALDGADLIEGLLDEDDEDDPRRRLLLLALLAVFLCILCAVGYLFIKYLIEPEPLPDLLPEIIDVNIAPHYLYSIYGVDTPVGVTVSPDNERIYVSESGGERLIKVFDLDGELLFSFSPPYTTTGQRSPVYLDTDSTGRVFVVDRRQHSVFVYTADGEYLDTLLEPDLALSEYVSQHAGGLNADTVFWYDIFEGTVYFQPTADDAVLTLPGPNFADRWAPIGLRITDDNTLFITDAVSEERHSVYQFNIPDTPLLESWHEANPIPNQFGEYGQGGGQFLFPNVVVIDSQGRRYVSDGNNGRVSIWNADGSFQSHIGTGTGAGALSLPRGIFIDDEDRLHIVDAVGQHVVVYDVSGEYPEFLFVFGDFGIEDGLFNYPNDVFVDDTGRLYVVDRENHRVQVWSY